MVFLEMILQMIFGDLVHRSGKFLRWIFVTVVDNIREKKTVPFNTYKQRFERDTDPSNRMNNGIIHNVLGIAALLSVVFIVVWITDRLT